MTKENDFYDFAQEEVEEIFNNAIRGIDDVLETSRMRRQEKGILILIKTLIGLVKTNFLANLNTFRAIVEIYDHLINIAISLEKREKAETQIAELRRKIEEIKTKAKEEWQPFVDAVKQAIENKTRWLEDNK